MLVLSRREGEGIIFPALGISVQVLPRKGSTVRLGVKAPAEIRVMRQELCSAEDRDVGAWANVGEREVASCVAAVAERPAKLTERTTTGAREVAGERAREQRHALRGQLNTLSMALLVAEKQLEAGRAGEAEETLARAQEVLERLIDDGEATAPANPQRTVEALLVEDNPNEQALLSSYLNLNGVRVQAVEDGYAALDYLAANRRPDFVLLDMRLPRFDGRNTVMAIRQNPAYRGLKIFAVSGGTPAEFDVPVGTSGVDAWFQKPLNARQIVDAMHTAIAAN